MIPEPQNTASNPTESTGEQEDTTVSFHLGSVREEIAASSADARRNARRIFDALKQVCGVLDAMSATLESVHRNFRERDSAATVQADGNRTESMGLVELADRLSALEFAVDK